MQIQQLKPGFLPQKDHYDLPSIMKISVYLSERNYPVKSFLPLESPFQSLTV